MELNPRLELMHTHSNSTLEKLYPNPTPGLVYIFEGESWYEGTCLYTYTHDKCWRRIVMRID